MAFDVERLRREEFPWAAAGEAVYLDAASTGPLPERTLRAQAEFSRKRAAPHRLSHEEQFGVLDRCRALVAELVRAPDHAIALSVNTGAGINLAAWGLPLGPGDVVVIPDLEFPANVYPWLAASRARGYAVRTVPARDGLLDEEA
ncbi:MAG TPA: aminotransferase class V-fold PLP-dependent enzyme, partial [Gemmatimonadaceae bacterium]|nr:aminotransferase class V-fold PLP-dependent enzyme [Gemmatimonadaceae bacterium]